MSLCYHCPPERRRVLEVFAGVAGFSKACVEAGLIVGATIGRPSAEIKASKTSKSQSFLQALPIDDLCNPFYLDDLRLQIAWRLYFHIHFGIVCSSWCPATHGPHLGSLGGGSSRVGPGSALSSLFFQGIFALGSSRVGPVIPSPCSPNWFLGLGSSRVDSRVPHPAPPHWVPWPGFLAC